MDDDSPLPSFLTKRMHGIQQLALEVPQVRELNPSGAPDDYAPKRRGNMTTNGLSSRRDRAAVDLDALADQIGAEAQRAAEAHRSVRTDDRADWTPLAELRRQLSTLTYGEMMEFCEGIMTLVADKQDRQVADGNALAALLHQWTQRHDPAK
jgi:hypothetical protein